MDGANRHFKSVLIGNMSSKEPNSLKKCTLLFQTLQELVAFQQTVNPGGYLMVPQVNLILAKFSEEDIDIAVRQYRGEVKMNIDINSFVHE